ncbi:hypothetical protein ACN9MC_35325 (plasmid) [Ensifer adhaerens]|uniref:hypothetical protein n=1 Tax=Ensifer adhaerens TaxID=106592 RepID=UPI003CF740B7
MTSPAFETEILALLRTPVDGNEICRAYFDKMTRRYLSRIISEEMIEEHRKAPSGRHSEALGRVLAYFRRLPASRQYQLRKASNGKFGIVRMPTRRNARGSPVGVDTFETVEAGYHGIFLLKLKDMMEADNG